MIVKTGIDLVDLGEFFQAVQSGGERFLRKIFLPSELKERKIEHLAGVFAAKESVIKALGITAGEWLKLEIKKEPSGRPFLILDESLKKNLVSFDLSISHTKDYVVAVFVALI